MKYTTTTEREGFASRKQVFESLNAANQSAKQAIRHGASRVTVRNWEGQHVRTHLPTGPGNSRPISYTIHNGEPVYTR